MAAAAWLHAGSLLPCLAFWRVPAAYDWALGHPWGPRDGACHAARHGGRVLADGRDQRQASPSPGVAVVMVSLVGIQGAFMGALISFAPHPLYAAYAGNPILRSGLAGVMMCIPASLIYLASTVWALFRMLRSGRAQRTKPALQEGEMRSVF